MSGSIGNPQMPGTTLPDLEGIVNSDERAASTHQDYLGVWEEYEENFAAAPFEYGLLEIQRVLKHMRGLGHQLDLAQITAVDALQSSLDLVVGSHQVRLNDG